MAPNLQFTGAEHQNDKGQSVRGILRGSPEIYIGSLDQLDNLRSACVDLLAAAFFVAAAAAAAGAAAAAAALLLSFAHPPICKRMNRPHVATHL